MLSKLFVIFLVVAGGVFFACIFSIPVRQIGLFYGDKIKFLSQKRRVLNIIAVLTWYGFLVLVLVSLFLLFYYSLTRYFSEMTWNHFLEMIRNTMERYIKVFPFLENINLGNDITKLFQTFLKIPGFVGKLVVSFLISIYLLLDWDSYLNSFQTWRAKSLSENSNRKLNYLIKEAKNNFYGYLKGQFLDAIIMAVLLSFGLWIIGVPLGIPIGILAGIGNFIPYVGAILAFTLTIGICFIEQRVRTLMIALVFLLVILQLDSSLIGPKLLGQQMQVCPLFVILAVLIGGTLFGVSGMVLAVPIAGLLKSIIKNFYFQK